MKAKDLFMHQDILPWLARNQLTKLKNIQNTKKMASIRQILMQRDGLTSLEADNLVRDARVRVFNGDNPEEILFEEFGLEPDYIFELI